MPDSRSSLPSTHRFAIILLHAGASASNNLEPNDLFLGETFANLLFVQFCSDQCFQFSFWDNALEDTFSLTLIRCVFMAGQSFSPRRRTAVTKRRGTAPGL